MTGEVVTIWILVWAFYVVVLKKVLLKIGLLSQVFVLPRCAAFAGWCLRWFYPHQFDLACAGRTYVAYAAADRGRTDAAVRTIELLLKRVRARTASVCSWGTVNAAVDIYVNAGRYQQALSAENLWSSEAREAGRQHEPFSFALAQINRAEALHNLGRNDQALQTLAEVEPACQDQPLARNGTLLLRAWILAHHGRPGDARHTMGRVDADALRLRYRAEVHYTRSAVARASGDATEAERQARLGLAQARRAASQRNGLHLLAAALLDQGEVDAAARLLEAFARHPYRGQAAWGLVLQGRAYEQQGRPAQALAAYQEATHADPESWLCQFAREGMDRARAT